MKNSDLNHILKHVGEKKIIVDFDGVITKLKVDWNFLKKTLSELLDTHEPLDMGRLHLYSQITKKHQEYLNLVADYEIAGLNKNLKSPLFENLIKLEIEFSIFSSNSSQTIDSFLANQQVLISDIVSVDTVTFIKPHPEGLLKIVGNSPQDFVFIGDSINDRIAADLSNVKFIHYEF